jgi:hypothetical protein
MAHGLQKGHSGASSGANLTQVVRCDSIRSVGKYALGLLPLFCYHLEDSIEPHCVGTEYDEGSHIASGIRMSR